MFMCHHTSSSNDTVTLQEQILRGSGAFLKDQSRHQLQCELTPLPLHHATLTHSSQTSGTSGEFNQHCTTETVKGTAKRIFIFCDKKMCSKLSFWNVFSWICEHLLTLKLFQACVNFFYRYFEEYFSPNSCGAPLTSTVWKFYFNWL